MWRSITRYTGNFFPCTFCSYEGFMERKKAGSKGDSTLDRIKEFGKSRVSPIISSGCVGSPSALKYTQFKGKAPGISATLHSGIRPKRPNSVDDGPVVDTDGGCGSPELKKRKRKSIVWDVDNLQSKREVCTIAGASSASLQKMCPSPPFYNTATTCWEEERTTSPSEGGFLVGNARKAMDIKNEFSLVHRGGIEEATSFSTSPQPQIENEDIDYQRMGLSGRELMDDKNAKEAEHHLRVKFEEVEQSPVQRVANMLLDCRSVDDFYQMDKINEGTYGVVYKARNKTTGEIVALKKVKLEKDKEFPITSLREINMLLSIHHPSIINVKEVVVGHDLDNIFMVMDYVEHDLKELLKNMKQPFSQSEIKCLMLQLLEGVKYLHDNWIVHRDLKTSNLLLNNRGEVKICDFGLARQYESPLKTYTHMVVTLWYRAPELLLGYKQYSTAVDMWSLGCIMAELLTKQPLFNGKNEIDQLDKIFKVLGTPNETIWPEFAELPGAKCKFLNQPFNRLHEKFLPASFLGGQTPLCRNGFDLLIRLLLYDPRKRITAEEALQHPWFRVTPLPKMKELMPTFPPTYPIRREHKITS